MHLTYMYRSYVLLALLSLLLNLTLALAKPSPIPQASTPAPASQPAIAEPAVQPYQFFHSDGVGGNNAACWLSRLAFPETEGVTCKLAETISQIRGRQIWQCEGEQWRFCNGCRNLEAQLQGPKDLVGWKIQGC